MYYLFVQSYSQVPGPPKNFKDYQQQDWGSFSATFSQGVMGLAEPTRVECCSSKEGNRAGTESWIPECWSEMQIRWDPWGAFPAAHGRSHHSCYSKWQWSSVKASRFCFKRTQKSFWQGEREGKEKKRRRRKRRRRRRERGKGEEKEKEKKERETYEPLPPLSLHFFSTSSFEVRIMATRGQHVVKKQLQLS